MDNHVTSIFIALDIYLTHPEKSCEACALYQPRLDIFRPFPTCLRDAVRQFKQFSKYIPWEDKLSWLSYLISLLDRAAMLKQVHRRR